MTAYVKPVASGQEASTAAAVQAHLNRTLPPHMRPARIVALDAFPLTSNGKIDERSLAMRAARISTR